LIATFSTLLQRAVLLISSIFSVFERSFLFPNTISMGRDGSAVGGGPGERGLGGGVCDAVASLVDELRTAQIRKGSDFSIRQTATEFRRLSEFLSMFDVVDRFRDACLRAALLRDLLSDSNPRLGR
jgi:hypothetical protein